MEIIKLKRIDISRILRGLSLLELKGEIPKKEYIRLHKRFFKRLKGGKK